MNRNVLLMAPLAASAVFLLGCSTSMRPPHVPAPEVSFTIPPDTIPDGDSPIPFSGRICRLGTSCLELDPRPFEMCLLATNKRCGEKMTESLLAVNPEPAEPR
jgi:hypothetical protein